MSCLFLFLLTAETVGVFLWLKWKGWSWSTEHFPGCSSVFDVCWPKTCLFPWNPDWVYTSPFQPLDSLSVTLGLWQWLDRLTHRGPLSMNKSWLCKRDELWAEIGSEEKVLNSPCVPAACPGLLPLQKVKLHLKAFFLPVIKTYTFIKEAAGFQIETGNHYYWNQRATMICTPTLLSPSHLSFF